MNYSKLNPDKAAFTLIELLIVVLIIAILAAIAVPNFLEFQTRAKVSRAASDMRSIRLAIEAYYVDNNEYAETDVGIEDITQAGVGMYRLTTPISYLSTVPKSPFLEENMGFSGQPKNANKHQIYLYVRARIPLGISSIQDNVPSGGDGLDDSYNTDRSSYMGQGDLAKSLVERSKGYWMLKSVGPDNLDDRHTLGNNARVYDPTNGTISAGDLVIFSDISGFAN